MRTVTHSLVESKSGKSIILRIEIIDRFGKRVVNFSSVAGWRKILAHKYLGCELQQSNEQVARAHVGLEALKSAKNRKEGLEYLNIVNSLNGMELFFWSNKFMTNEKSRKAWRVLYG